MTMSSWLEIVAKRFVKENPQFKPRMLDGEQIGLFHGSVNLDGNVTLFVKCENLDTIEFVTSGPIGNPDATFQPKQ